MRENEIFVARLAFLLTLLLSKDLTSLLILVRLRIVCGDSVIFISRTILARVSDDCSNKIGKQRAYVRIARIYILNTFMSVFLNKKERKDYTENYISDKILIFLKYLFFRSLAVGSKSGYKLYSISSTGHLEKIYENGNNLFFCILTMCVMKMLWILLECSLKRNFLLLLISVFSFLFWDDTDFEDICIVERLFSSSLVAIVSLKSPRTLTVCHFRKGTEICNYSYSNTILAVKLNRAVSYHKLCLH